MSEIAMAPIQMPILAGLLSAFWWVPALNQQSAGAGTAFIVSTVLVTVLPLLAAGFAYGHRHGEPSPFTMLLGLTATGVQVWLWYRLRGGWMPTDVAEAVLWNHGLLYAGTAVMVARGVLVRKSARAARLLDGDYAQFLGPGGLGHKR